jgi:hypothetical protein
MTDPHDHYEDDLDGDECWSCVGGCCVDQDDIYCEYCSHPCDVCKPKPKIVDTGDELHQILGDALKTAQVKQE